MTKNGLQQDFLLGQLGHVSRLVHASIRPYYQTDMAGFDLKPSEFAVLSLLRANAPVSQRQLSDAVMISPPNMAALIDRLQERGLVRRDPHPDDRRLHALLLTPQGERLCADAEATVEALENRATAMLSPEEKRQLLSLLAKVLKG